MTVRDSLIRSYVAGLPGAFVESVPLAEWPEVRVWLECHRVNFFAVPCGRHSMFVVAPMLPPGRIAAVACAPARVITLWDIATRTDRGAAVVSEAMARGLAEWRERLGLAG